MNGILNINKPSGMTSHDVVYKIRRLLNEKKVGHTGTLDPDATGVLVICLGKATKIIQFLENDDKCYEGTITLGIATDTLDASGNITNIVDTSNVNPEQIKQVCETFIGEIDQIPPMVSALKVNGERLYNIARQGKTVDRKPRRVQIYEFDVKKIYYDKEPKSSLQSLFAKFDFRLKCSKGTYVRSLAEDIGNAIGCGAYLSRLIRTESGMFNIKDSLPLEKIQSYPQIATSAIYKIDDVLSFMPKIIVGFPDNLKFVNGAIINLSDESFSEPLEIDKFVRTYDSLGNLLGIGKLIKKDKDLAIVKPVKMLN